MEDRWPHYDPTLQALLRPEQRHPHGLYSAGDPWPIEAICAEFSRLAYVRFDEGDTAKLAAAMTKAGFGEPGLFSSTQAGPGRRGLLRRAWDRLFDPNAQAFGATSLDGETTIVAFRGTQADKLQDLITNRPTIPVRWDGPGRVHKGFLKAYEALRGPIDEWLGAARPRRLLVTGHSLGAAMATLMAARHDEAALVNFGSPRVGDQAFADHFAERSILRFVDCTDVVTNLPPAGLIYVHAGGMRYIDRHGTLHVTPPDPDRCKQDQEEAKRSYRRDHALRPGNVPVRWGADHAPVNYVSAVAGLRHDP